MMVLRIDVGAGIGLTPLLLTALLNDSSAYSILLSRLSKEPLESWASSLVPDSWSETMFVHNYEVTDDTIMALLPATHHITCHSPHPLSVCKGESGFLLLHLRPCAGA